MDERKAFEAWRRTPLQALTMTYGPKPHPDVEELAWRAWQAATLAERERAAKVVETQDTCGDYVGGWFSLLAEKIRKG